MKCMILSRNSTLYSTRRLADEGRKLGLKVKIVDTLRLSVLLGEGELGQREDRILYKNQPILIPDVVIPRIGASITSFGGCVVFQMEQMKIPLVNHSEGIYNTRDKFRCGQILSKEGFAMPRTLMLRRPSKKDLQTTDALERKTLFKAKVAGAIQMLGGPPVIIKLNKGTQGVGVILAQSMNDIYAQVDMLWKRKENFIIQQFIAESKGIDVRALVVNDKVVACMKRESKTGDFRSNTHQGGEVSAFDLPKEFQEIAVRASQAVGLKVAGVDMLVSKDFKIIEINSSPGFEGLEKATQVNVAKEIMKYAYSIAKNNRINKKKENQLIPQLEFPTYVRTDLIKN